jgi:hypothetical protein
MMEGELELAGSLCCVELMVKNRKVTKKSKNANVHPEILGVS